MAKTSNRVTPDWMEKKGLVEISPGVYGRPNMLDKALKQSMPAGSLFGKSPIEEPDPMVVKSNRKIKNAFKVVIDNIEFDSRLEGYMYGLLKQYRIPFELKKTYVLQEGFRYGKDWIRPITLTVDFILKQYHLIIDTKGFANDRAPMKYKMLKKHLFDQGLFMNFELPSNHKECQEVINNLIKTV